MPCVETPLTPAFPCFVLARADDCVDDIKEFCSTTEVGENRLRDCLTKQQEAESKGNVDGEKSPGTCASKPAGGSAITTHECPPREQARRSPSPAR